MGLFGKNKEIALGPKARERKALQRVVADQGIDPDDLEYTADDRTSTAKVVDKKTGKVVHRTSW
jgi:hypothetical protein